MTQADTHDALAELRRNPLLELVLRQIRESLNYVRSADAALRSGRPRNAAIIAISDARYRLSFLADFLDGGRS